jgi:hypothetical protein
MLGGISPRSRVAATRLASVPLGLLASLALVPLARANHGPGTSGGGASTASGELLKPGAVDFSLRLDFTQFESVSETQARQHATTSGEFDALRRAEVVTASLSYGVNDLLQVGASWGYYRGTDFVHAEFDPQTGATSSSGDPRGITDLWLQSKLQLTKGAPGNLALLAALKLPTGNDSQHLDDGTRIEPSSQPGTGAVDGQAGLAWSRFLTSRLTLDASALYTLRGEAHRFEVGDRLDAGVALAWRLTEAIDDFPNWSVSAEALLVWLERDREDGVRNDSSGGTTLFLSPGVRARMSRRAALTFAQAFPVVQNLNGDQPKVRFKATLGLSYAF